jgi:hypothetical protein
MSKQLILASIEAGDVMSINPEELLSYEWDQVELELLHSSILRLLDKIKKDDPKKKKLKIILLLIILTQILLK